METTANALFLEMNEQINNIHPTSILHRAELCYQITEKALHKLHEFMESYQFLTNAEEVQYFKYIQPKFLRELIYYTELYYLESLRPSKDRKSILHYFKETQIYNNQFFERNLTLYNYYRTGRTHLDATIFITEAQSTCFSLGGIIQNNSHLFQSGSYKLARLQAV